MRYVFIVGPVASDLLFRKKQLVVETIATQYALKMFLPLEEATENTLIDIIQTIRAAEFVLVDLSLERPSCYYELGVAQTLGVPVEIIAEFGTPIHQLDNRSLVNFYKGIEHYGELIRMIFAKRVKPLTKPTTRTNI